MFVRSNIPADNASRNQGITNGKLKKSLEKLSTGYRINKAGDDAAGLAISELMRNQIHGLDQAMRNVNDGISMTNTGEGALEEVHSMLGRMKTLAVQAANGTYNTGARMNLEAERQQLLEEIDRICANSDFNQIPLFSGDAPPPPVKPPQKQDDIPLQIGHSEEELLNVSRYYVGSEALLLNGTDFSSVEKANESIPLIEDAIQAVSDIRADFGAVNNHLEHTHNNLSVTDENITTAESNIRDTDISDEFTNYTKLNVMHQASNSMLAQANTLPQMVMNLLQN